MPPRPSRFEKFKEESLALIKERPYYTNKNVYEYLEKKYPEEDFVYATFRRVVAGWKKGVGHSGLEEECEIVGIPLDSVNHYWYKGKNFSIHSKNKGTTYEEFRKDLIEDLKEYSPTFKKIERQPCKDGHLLIVDPADVHFGKLCNTYEGSDDYNIQIARSRVLNGVEGLLEKSSGFNIEKIMLVIGNDMLHTENGKTTTGGTPQDSDGMWYEAFLAAKETIIDMIELLLPVADIHCHYDPSNHDYISGFMLADSIKSYFRNNKNMTFDFSISHRKYYKWNQSLIGTTHGDGAKWKDLPNLMAMEAKEDWATTSHKYFYTHHIHHKQAQDFIGVTCESLRSPSSADSWHSKKGFDHSPRAIEAFIHSKEFGQCARLTHNF